MVTCVEASNVVEAASVDDVQCRQVERPHGRLVGLCLSAVQELLQDKDGTEREARLCGLELALAAQALEPGKGTGDFVWVKRLDDRQVGIMVGDVEGHGDEAAKVTVLLHQYLEDPAIRDLAARAPAHELLSHLDSNCDFEERAVALSFVKIDSVAQTLEYANAGLPWLEIISLEGEVRTLRDVGLPLGKGYFADSNPGTSVHKLLPSDIVVMMTDGVADSTMVSGLRVHEMMRNSPKLLFGAPETPHEEANHVLSQVDTVRDDFTLLAFRVAA